MQTFVASWAIANKEDVIAAVPLSLHDCRDTCYHEMTRILEHRVQLAAIKQDANFYDADMLTWQSWTQELGNQMLWSAQVAYQSDKEDFESYSVPRAIDRLCRKYPSVQFIPTKTDDAFSERPYIGVQLVGDTSVIPAWYWSALILRHAIWSPKWRDVNKLIETCEGGQRANYRAWERLRAGAELPAWQMLALRYGPVSSWNDRALIQLRAGLLHQNPNQIKVTE